MQVFEPKRKQLGGMVDVVHRAFRSRKLHPHSREVRVALIQYQLWMTTEFAQVLERLENMLPCLLRRVSFFVVGNISLLRLREPLVQSNLQRTQLYLNVLNNLRREVVQNIFLHAA
jgi:hypothetical protein